MVNGKKLIYGLFILIGIIFYNCLSIAMEKPYHHLPDGTFRNPEGSPKRDPNVKWSYKIFNQEKKKLEMTVPKGHVVEKEKVLSDLKKYQVDDYIAWIGHAYDHQDMSTIRKFPYKSAKVLLPLKLSKYFKRYKDVNEMDWYDEIQINDNLKVTFLPAVHWSKRSLTDTNKSLWGNFLIEYNGKKILFGCDTGIGDIYKDIGNKYGPIDLTFINIGAYNFYPIMPFKDKSIYHTNPEEALEIAKNLKSKKVIGMHWGTFVLSLEPIMEPPIRFKNGAEKYGFKKEDAIIYKIGEFGSLKKLLNFLEKPCWFFDK